MRYKNQKQKKQKKNKKTDLAMREVDNVIKFTNTTQLINLNAKMFCVKNSKEIIRNLILLGTNNK